MPRAAQVGEDGEHPPVGAGVGVDAEFEEDLLHVGLDGALGDEQETQPTTPSTPPTPPPSSASSPQGTQPQ
jgi:hypothetical protein